MYWLCCINTFFNLHFVLKFSLKVVPFPSLLEVSIDPPISCTIYLQIERPRPVPCLFLWEFSVSLPKLTKRFSSPSLEIPIPVSYIDRLKLIKHSSPVLISYLLSSYCFIWYFSTIFAIDRPWLDMVLFFISLFNSFGMILV